MANNIMWCSTCQKVTDCEIIGEGKVTYGYGVYVKNKCKECGNVKTIYGKEEKEEGGYYHDGGWYSENE